MNTKRILSVVICMVLSIPLLAQSQYTYGGRTINKYTGTQSIYYGLRLGVSLSSISSDISELDGSSIQAGLSFGGIVGFQLSPTTPVFLETGLLYTEKGGKGNVNGEKTVYNLNYFEVPIVARYRVELDDDIFINPFFGGYLALGIGGKIKHYAQKISESSFSDDCFQRFDGGLRLGCGLEYSMMYLDVAYELGLANISHSDFDSAKNRSLLISVGVNF